MRTLKGKLSQYSTPTGARAIGVRRVASPAGEGRCRHSARSERWQRPEVAMLVFRIHVRDPQFYAVPAAGRAKNGNLRIMGFPPIGIMSLSAVLKRAGHECVMFDQANSETPNQVIVEQIRTMRPQLVGLSFLSAS